MEHGTQRALRHRSGETFKIRPAVLSDLKRIVEITIAASDDQALANFNYPHRHEFLGDHSYHWTVLLRSMFYDANSFVLVAESEKESLVPSDKLTHKTSGNIVAWAELEWKSTLPDDIPPDPYSYDTWKMVAWIYSSNKSLVKGKFYDYKSNFEKLIWSRRDDDPAHRKIFVDTRRRINDEHWTKVPRIVYLSALYTQPEFQGKGASGLLKDWVLGFVNRNNVSVGLIASHPPSIAIYKHWGFHEIDVVRMQKEGEEQCVELSVLLQDPLK